MWQPDGVALYFQLEFFLFSSFRFCLSEGNITLFWTIILSCFGCCVVGLIFANTFHTLLFLSLESIRYFWIWVKTAACNFYTKHACYIFVKTVNNKLHLKQDNVGAVYQIIVQANSHLESLDYVDSKIICVKNLALLPSSASSFNCRNTKLRNNQSKQGGGS